MTSYGWQLLGADLNYRTTLPKGERTHVLHINEPIRCTVHQNVMFFHLLKNYKKCVYASRNNLYWSVLQANYIVASLRVNTRALLFLLLRYTLLLLFPLVFPFCSVLSSLSLSSPVCCRLLLPFGVVWILKPLSPSLHSRASPPVLPH